MGLHEFHLIHASSKQQYWLKLCAQLCAPDDGRRDRLKHVKHSVEINKSRNVAACWLQFGNLFAMHGHMNVKFLEVTVYVIKKKKFIWT